MAAQLNLGNVEINSDFLRYRKAQRSFALATSVTEEEAQEELVPVKKRGLQKTKQ